MIDDPNIRPEPFNPDAVERHKFTSIYEVSGKREHTHIMECVDASDYDRLHHAYDESEAARVRQMRTIEELTRERDALAAECRAWRLPPEGCREGTNRRIAIKEARAITNAHAPARRLVEGEQHEH